VEAFSSVLKGFPAFYGLSASSQLPQRLRKPLILLMKERMKFPHFATAQRCVIPRKRTSEQTDRPLGCPLSRE